MILCFSSSLLMLLLLLFMFDSLFSVLLLFTAMLLSPLCTGGSDHVRILLSGTLIVDLGVSGLHSGERRGERGGEGS